MRTVKIKKPILVEVLTKNRNAHRELYEKAFEGYRDECMKCLNHNLQALTEGKRVEVRIYESCPVDHTEDYDTILNMLDMSVDDVIELSHSEFQQYVEDNWQWRESWNNSNSKYISHR